jgi:hypothetical protein
VLVRVLRGKGNNNKWSRIERERERERERGAQQVQAFYGDDRGGLSLMA